MIIRRDRTIGETFVARVCEIVQVKGSVRDLAQSPDAILVQQADTSRSMSPYQMPSVSMTTEYHIVSLNVRLSFHHSSVTVTYCFTRPL